MPLVQIAKWCAKLGVAASCALAPAFLPAQTGPSIALSGVMGEKALLVIDGQARAMSIGHTFQDVKLLSVSSQEAVVESGGKRVTLMVGGSQVSLGGGASSGSRILLTAGSGGHFVTRGTINGRSVTFMVDTGATSVALSQAEAERIGLKYKDGIQGVGNTANGQVLTYRTKIGSLRINDVEVFDVDAAVLVAPMDMVLLGNSFLMRFQMKRENNIMTLEKKS